VNNTITNRQHHPVCFILTSVGRLADATSIDFVYHVCAYLPVIGFLTVFLPNLHEHHPHQDESAITPAVT